MTAIIRRRTCSVGITLVAVGFCAGIVRAQCPDRIPQSVINSLQHPKIRAAAANSPRITAAFIAQNGGITALIQEVQRQIEHDRAWLAQEQANQGSMAQQGISDINRARDGREAMQAVRDSLRLSEASLQVLQCHAGRGGAPEATQHSPSQTAVSADVKRWQEDAVNTANGDRVDMVNNVVGSWQPPRGYAGIGSPSGTAVSLEDPFAASPPDQCQPGISFGNVRLATDGAAIDYELSAIQSSGGACTVSFGIQMRAGAQAVLLPSRTLVIPAAGVTLTESVRLPVPVDATTGACTDAEPIRRAHLERRDQLAAKYKKVQGLAMDTIASRRELERSVTSRDIGNAILGVGIALDALKLGLSAVSPAASNALDFGQCVGVELSTYVGKTVAACGGKNNSECVDTVLTDGTVWVEKNLACAFKQTFNHVDKLTDVIMIAKQAKEINDSLNARSKTLDVMGELDASLEAAAARLARIQEDRAYIDEAVRQLDGLCRSPVIQLTAVDVRPLSVSGK